MPRPESYARERYIQSAGSLPERRIITAPTKLSRCGDILADAADAEVTSFVQFFLINQTPTSDTTSTGSGPVRPDLDNKAHLAHLPPWDAAVKNAPSLGERIKSKTQDLLDNWALQTYMDGGDPTPILNQLKRPAAPNGQAPAGSHTSAKTLKPDPVAPGTPASPSPSGPADKPSTSDASLITMLRADEPQWQVSGRQGSKPVINIAPRTATRRLPPNAFSLGALITAVHGFYNLTGVLYTQAGFSMNAALWAVGVTFDQTWESLGYHRGRLVRSIPLTPGEQLEIQVKTWDKLTTKKNLVEAIEHNMSAELTGEEKWTLATKMTTTNQTNASISPTGGVNANVGLPMKAVNVGGGGNLGLSGQLAHALTTGMDNTSEMIQSLTSKAAMSLKTSRTSSVETIHEMGKEETTKQVIANTNRSRALTYHYFEVVEDFRVSTRAADADIYLLVPLDLPKVTPEWVLCHESALRRLLPSEIYYAGFEGAKRMRIRDCTGARAQFNFAGLFGGGSGGGGGSQEETDSAVSRAVETCDALADAVIGRYQNLRDAVIVGIGSEETAGLIAATFGNMLKVGQHVVDTADPGHAGGSGSAPPAGATQLGPVVKAGVDKVDQMLKDARNTFIARLKPNV